MKEHSTARVDGTRNVSVVVRGWRCLEENSLSNNPGSGRRNAGHGFTALAFHLDASPGSLLGPTSEGDLTFSIAFEFEWRPFAVAGRTFCFSHKPTTRLEQARCSHWGPAIYKWEGKITKGPFQGKLGVLIGETDDLRSRINQYATGTQPSGNKYWRTEFLECSEPYLFVLECNRLELANGIVIPASEMLRSKNGRLVMEQLLILKERHTHDEMKWVVNKWE